MAVALNTEQYNLIIDTIRAGFTFEGKVVRGNNRIATVLVTQGNLGLRIGDVLKLKFNSFLKDGGRWRLDIIEEKTNKKREFTVPNEVYNFIKMYVLENMISPSTKIFDISVRAVQKHLKIVCDFLGLRKVGTHSFRKYFATNIYINSNYNILLVSRLLQHAEVKTTQRYIGIDNKEIEDALKNHICIR